MMIRGLKSEILLCLNFGAWHNSSLIGRQGYLKIYDLLFLLGSDFIYFFYKFVCYLLHILLGFIEFIF